MPTRYEILAPDTSPAHVRLPMAAKRRGLGIRAARVVVLGQLLRGRNPIVATLDQIKSEEETLLRLEDQGYVCFKEESGPRISLKSILQRAANAVNVPSPAPTPVVKLRSDKPEDVAPAIELRSNEPAPEVEPEPEVEEEVVDDAPEAEAVEAVEDVDEIEALRKIVTTSLSMAQLRDICALTDPEVNPHSTKKKTILRIFTALENGAILPLSEVEEFLASE